MAGLKLPCPCCGEEEAPIMLDLAEVDFTCRSCDETFTVERVRELINRWTPALAWVSKMPTGEAGQQ